MVTASASSADYCSAVTVAGGRLLDEALIDQLRGLGLRATQPRLAVLRTLGERPHLAADEVVEDVRRLLGAVSLQAVYDTLNTLTTAGVLRRFEPAGSAMRYEIAAGNHHHLVCRSCGGVEDVTCVVGAVPCAVPPETGGFVVDETEVTYWGTCDACRGTTSPDPSFDRTDHLPAREETP